MFAFSERFHIEGMWKRMKKILFKRVAPAIISLRKYALHLKIYIYLIAEHLTCQKLVPFSSPTYAFRKRDLSNHFSSLVEFLVMLAQK